ncbi:TetR/AcrR family transcriptional regulator [Aerococcus loyolae]|uniref:TetR/AcrR family transcriptional regulator n=1 Tax=Aerococcus urinae TaxID=1376 RepID=A0A2I1L897_9LACT|nr:TetR/AcrR family transcriptional regulator [Aerococcus loyolae]KAA9264081.1 TetR/AcrR family transcriptional regulator [Aerococcus loyolae]PKY86845.1 TetR/AcrR family transcriptional regulator [Aerococcus loyolae]PKZ04070.1 TetR/AcrR family transcriptional regulator [Aerococcus loyolae]RAV81171.1 TetR/AcrR family transcriptional regulator [Aerococcus loyolae]
MRSGLGRGHSVVNRKVSSSQEILKVALQLVQEEGIQAVNMRRLAKRCQISLGVLYNYFEDKNDLLLQTVAAVWRDILIPDQAGHLNRSSQPLSQAFMTLYQLLAEGAKKYPHFFSQHTLVFSQSQKSQANEQMDRYINHLKGYLLQCLEDDPDIRNQAFEKHSADQVVDFLFAIFINQVMQGKLDIGLFIDFIDRYLYDH